MARRLISLTLLGLLAGLLPFSLPAQISGTLAGVILDPNREPLPRVRVRLLDTAGTEVARTLSDRHGRFAFENLVARQYTLTASLVGFATITQEAVSGTHIELLLPLAPVREQIVVTATRTEAPTGQLGATHTVVSADEMRNRQVIPVHEAVRPVAGVAVVRSGGVGSTTSIFVRGGELDHNKVLLDGVVLNDPGGSFFFDNLTAENLERVEVVRGPQSALFGSDAMASVIQVFTRRGRSETLRPRFFLSGEGGNNDTWRTRAGVSGAAGRVDYSFQWARLSTDNREPNNVFHNASLSGNVGVALRRTTTLRFTLRGELGRVGTPGPTAFERADRDAFFRRRDAAFGVTLVDQTARWWEQRLLYSFTKSRQVSRNLVADPPFVPMFEGRSAPFAFFDFPLDFLNDNRRHRISYQSDWRAGGVGRRAGRHVVTFAFEWDREQGAFGDRLFGALPVEAQRDNLGWTFQHQALWGRLFLTNGVRVEDNNSFGVSLVPRSSLAFFLRQSSGAVGATKLKFNFGLGIKEPTLVESFSPSPFFLGNAELAPERVRSFDLGVEQRFWWDRAKLEVNWFDNRFRDLIGFEITDFLTFSGSFFNIGRTKAKGSEVVLELAPGGGLRGRGSYTFLDSQVTRSGTVFDPVFEEGNRLLRRPKHGGALELFWDWRRLSVASTTLFVGRRSDSDFSLLSLTSNSGYTRWDVAGSYRTRHGITYFGVVENLLNRDTMEVLGFPALKLTFRAGARVRF